MKVMTSYLYGLSEAETADTHQKTSAEAPFQISGNEQADMFFHRVELQYFEQRKYMLYLYQEL